MIVDPAALAWDAPRFEAAVAKRRSTAGVAEALPLLEYARAARTGTARPQPHERAGERAPPEADTPARGTTPDALGIHWQLLLPIGISFYVFHSISYLVDVYRGDAKVSRNIIDFAAFLALFPQLVAGPILRYKDLAPQFEHREHSWELFNAGWQRFLIGLS
ncbi:MAG: hypothetical protein J0H57_24695, partial [Rhodospirillales bacterium]|nr:hypothetical protein [Rhodospirillales bacterium]